MHSYKVEEIRVIRLGFYTGIGGEINEIIKAKS